MPARAADIPAAALPNAAIPTEPAKAANGDLAHASQSELDELRRLEIRKRFAKGKPVSRMDKKFAGIKYEEEDGFVRGYLGVINFIYHEHGVTVSKNNLSKWVRGISLPTEMSCRDPFPACEPPDRWRKSSVKEWIIKYLPKPSETARNGKRNGYTDWISERQRTIAIREQKELLWAEQEKDKRYILRSEAEAANDAIVQKLRSIIKNAWRRQLPNEMQIGLSNILKRGLSEDQMLAATRELFVEVGRKIMRNIEDQCEKA